MRITPVAIAALLLAMPGSARATPDTLVSSLQRLAGRGNAEAVYHLGMAYQTGSGVAQDHRKALEAFRRAAALGDPLGAYKLGCYYAGQDGEVLTPDMEQALRYKLVAAKAGYALAQQDVGVIYAMTGKVAEGLAWAERSAAQGWSGGLMTLASAYKAAPGVSPDPAKTAAYFRLFLERTDAGEEQRAWLRRFEAGLTAAERARAEAIVRDYRPQPTTLTLKALSGRRAAEALVAAARPN